MVALLPGATGAPGNPLAPPTAHQAAPKVGPVLLGRRGELGDGASPSRTGSNKRCQFGTSLAAGRLQLARHAARRSQQGARARGIGAQLTPSWCRRVTCVQAGAAGAEACGMSGASHPRPQPAWAASEPVAANIKMPAGPTVNLSAVSATLAAAGSNTPGGYSDASSPYARGSSTHSSPYNISRTGSGASDGSVAADAAAARPAELLQALGGAGTGSRPGTPSTEGGAATPPRMAPPSGNAALSIEATLQGEACREEGGAGWVEIHAAVLHAGRLLNWYLQPPPGSRCILQGQRLIG